MLSAGRFYHIHNERASESPSPLLLGLSGEQWQRSKNVVLTHRTCLRARVCSFLKGRLYFAEQAQEEKKRKTKLHEG